MTQKTTVRPLREADLDAADHIMRLAFGTFIGLPHPETFAGDSSYVRTRWRAHPAAAFALEVDGVVAGSNFATRWGRFGFFGPLSIHPQFWERGLATALMEPVLECFERWELAHVGLFTFPHSTKHIGLYQKFGFRPRALTMVMSRPVGAPAAAAAGLDPPARYSALSAAERGDARAACGAISRAAYPELDVASEIEVVDAQRWGDTVLLREGERSLGFGVCHVGAGTEAGSDTCFVKFAAVAPGRDAPRHLEDLLGACEAFARSAGATRLVAGVNTARTEAYELLLARGFRVDITGIAMHRPNEPGFSRPGCFVLDDWR